MAEEFVLKVKLVPEGREFETGLEKSIKRTVKRTSKDRDVVSGITNMFTNAFRQLGGGLGGAVANVMEKGQGLLQFLMKGGRGGRMGAVAGVGAVAGGVAGVVIALVGAIKDLLMKIFNVLVSSSGILRNSLKILKQSFMLALKPLADTVGLVLLPIAIFFMSLFSEFYKLFGESFLKKFVGLIKKVVRVAVLLGKIIALFIAFRNPLRVGVELLRRLNNLVVGVASLVIDTFKKEIKGVVDIISRGVGWITDSIGGFISNVVSAIFGLPSMIVEGIRSFMDMIIKGIKNLPSLIIEGLKGVISSISNLLGFQVGGFVERTGIYKLHAGERVLTNAERQLLDIVKRKGSNVFNIYMNFEGVSARDKYEIAEEVRRVLRDLMLRKEIGEVTEWEWNW